eukprot:s4855_g4.t1
MLTAGELANLADVTHNQSGEETLNNEGHPSDDVALEKLREALRQDAPECKDVPDAILRKCLAFQDGDIEKAASTAAGFFNFRSQARPKNSAIEGHRSQLLHQLRQLLSPVVEDDVRVFACATALGAAKIRNKLCSEQGGSWRWDSDMPFEMVVGDAVVNPEDGLVLVRSGWLAKGVVYRERGHDDRGFDIIRIQLKTHKALKETYVFSINLGSDMWAMRIPASEVSRALKTGLHWLLPGKKDSEDPNEFAAACLVFNMAKLDPDACPIEEYQKLSLFLIERATDSLDVQTRGVALIIDFRSVQFTKLWSVLRLEDIKRGLGCWVGAFPCRLRRIWILDAPLPVRVLTSLVKKFLTPKVRNRIDFVTPKDLQRIREDFVDCIVVPDSLGGTDPFDWDAQVEGYLRCDPRLPLRSPTLLSL